jgi:hypothetical protein
MPGVHSSFGGDADLSFVQPRPAADRTFAGLRQPIFAEREPARAAARRLDRDAVARGTRRSDEVTEIVLDISTSEPKLSGNRRY